MDKNIIDEIIRIKDFLPKKQKQLCDYLAFNYMEVNMMTVAELADNADVGPTTVMRLMKTLGYDNYTSFKKDLFNASLMNTTSSYRGIKQSFALGDSGASSNIISSIWTDATRITDNLVTPENLRQLDYAVQKMVGANRIYVLGMRSSRSAAIYFEGMVDRFCPKIRQLSNEQEYIYDKASQIGESDVLLVFSVWPCTRRTIEVAEFCHEHGVPILLVTNSSLNPLCKIAQAVIDTNSVHSGSGILPTMLVVEAMIAELGHKLDPESTKNLEHLEQLLDQQNLFIWEQKPKYSPKKNYIHFWG